jgi:hypothetical protein
LTQGDFVKINNPKDGESALPFLMKRIQEWDYTVPLCIKLEKYDDGRSLSQNALFHVWCADLSKAFIEKIPTATKENMKLMLKQRFLGTYDVKVGKTVIEGQVKSSSKLTKGEMVYFMDNVYHWARDNGVLLKVPHDSEYARLQNQQEQ